METAIFYDETHSVFPVVPFFLLSVRNLLFTYPQPRDFSSLAGMLGWESVPSFVVFLLGVSWPFNLLVEFLIAAVDTFRPADLDECVRMISLA